MTIAGHFKLLVVRETTGISVELRTKYVWASSQAKKS